MFEREFAVFFLTERGSPRNLVTTDITDTTVGLSWTPAPGTVNHYRIIWKSHYDDTMGEKRVPGNTMDAVIEGLEPETKYRISVYAAYSSGEGDPVEGEAFTDGKCNTLPPFLTFCF